MTSRGSLRNFSLSSNLISRAHREEFGLVMNYSKELCCFLCADINMRNTENLKKHSYLSSYELIVLCSDDTDVYLIPLKLEK